MHTAYSDQRLNCRLIVMALLLAVMSASAAGAPQFAKTGEFTRDQVTSMARELAKTSFEPPSEVPEELAELQYDEYRAIRFRPEKAVWVKKVALITGSKGGIGSAISSQLVNDGYRVIATYFTGLFAKSSVFAVWSL